jgi:hypothetical protein
VNLNILGRYRLAVKRAAQFAEEGAAGLYKDNPRFLEVTLKYYRDQALALEAQLKQMGRNPSLSSLASINQR